MCFDTACSEIGNSAARSLTLASPWSLRNSTIVQRTGSPRARNVSLDRWSISVATTEAYSTRSLNVNLPSSAVGEVDRSTRSRAAGPGSRSPATGQSVGRLTVLDDGTVVLLIQSLDGSTSTRIEFTSEIGGFCGLDALALALGPDGTPSGCVVMACTDGTEADAPVAIEIVDGVAGLRSHCRSALRTTSAIDHRDHPAT